MTQRDIELHTAKVLLTEAMNRRGAGSSHAVLLRWAGNARKRAMAIEIDGPAQGTLALAPPSHPSSTEAG